MIYRQFSKIVGWALLVGALIVFCYTYLGMAMDASFRSPHAVGIMGVDQKQGVKRIYKLE